MPKGRSTRHCVRPTGDCSVDRECNFSVNKNQPPENFAGDCNFALLAQRILVLTTPVGSIGSFNRSDLNAILAA